MEPRTYIPDPKALIDSVHARGVTVCRSATILRRASSREHLSMRSLRPAMGARMAMPLFGLCDRRYMDNFFQVCPSTERGYRFGLLMWLDWRQNYHNTTCADIVLLHCHGSTGFTIATLSKETAYRGAGPDRWAGWGDRHRLVLRACPGLIGRFFAFEVKANGVLAVGERLPLLGVHDIGGFPRRAKILN